MGRQENSQTILKELGLDGKAKGLDLPVVMNREAAPEQTTELSKEDPGTFKRIAALMNYVAQDRPDTQAAVSHLCSDV